MKSIELFLKEGEGLTIEFKEKFSTKIVHDIVAFANAKGGVILLGVSDDGHIKGEKLSNQLKAQIVDLGRNCKPSIALQVEKTQDNVIIIEVPEGEDKPYLCSEGFFKRFDGLTQKLDPAEVRKIFKKGFFSKYESYFCEGATLADISLEKMNKFLKESHSKLSANLKNISNLLEVIKVLKDDKLTNAALLVFAKDVSDFFPHCQIFLVAYKGTEGISIYDKKYVRDDLVSQFNEALLFCKKHLNVKSEISGGQRQDFYEIPIEALREAIANAIIHRDYGMTGTNIQVEIHEDRVVISNPGGLPEGFLLSSLGKKSIRRNEIIADLFSRMGKAERFGSGINRIRELIKASDGPAPVFESDMFFTVTFHRPQEFRPVSPNLIATSKYSKPVLNPFSSEEAILQNIKANPKITQKEIAMQTGLSLEGVRYHIKKLIKNKIIYHQGAKKNGSWEIISSKETFFLGKKGGRRK